MPDRLQPVFSIITVTFNAETVLERTMLSVLNQTYSNIEYILVDGASTDGTLAIARKHVHRLAHLVSEPDGGLYDAMNKAMRIATGDYLCFLNAGDCFCKDDVLQRIVENLPDADTLPDVIYGETAVVDAAGRFIRMRRLSAPDELTWRSFKQGMLVCHQAFIARREICPAYNLTYRYSADFDWCIRVLKQAHATHNARFTLVNYLQEGLTTRHHRASLCERFRIMAHHYGWCSTVLHHLWFVVRLVLRK